MKSNLTGKILRVVVIVLLLNTVLLGLFNSIVWLNKFKRDMESLKYEMAGRLSQNLITPLWNFNDQFVQSIIQNEMYEKNVLAIIIRDSNGKLYKGMIKDDSWESKEYTEDMAERLKESWQTNSVDIIREKDVLGVVTVYLTDHFFKEEQLRMVLIVAIFGILAAAVTMWILMKLFGVIFINPIKHLLYAAQAMGKGDLSQKIEISGKDEIGSFASALEKMQGNLLVMVKQIKSSIDLLKTTSVELFNSSRQQADASMEQSSALTETATTVEELTATSKQIAENAQTVAELARQSLTGMETIRNNTDQEANRILTLGEKSQAIGEVVEIIDGIAKETNILALNASIEAERAGDAGKGFAVVAIEIRDLAKNVAKSTKQIRELIKEIQDATNASVMATENVGKSVEQGIDLSKQTADSANHISLATQQQESATSQVGAAIKQMSDIIGQTTAGANKIADTAHQLVDLTSSQEGLIEQFTITSTQ